MGAYLTLPNLIMEKNRYIYIHFYICKADIIKYILPPLQPCKDSVQRKRRMIFS